jgi:hypothetical protein
MIITPSGPTDLASTRRSGIASRVSANSRFPAPRMIGDTHQVIHVDEVAVGQGLHEAGAAVDEDVGALLLLELGHLLGEVALDKVRVPLERFAERGGDDVLGHAVELLGLPVLVGLPGPRLGEVLVGHAAEQQRVARRQLIALELVSVPAAVEGERPGSSRGTWVFPGPFITPSAVRNSDTTTRPICRSSLRGTRLH